MTSCCLGGFVCLFFECPHLANVKVDNLILVLHFYYFFLKIQWYIKYKKHYLRFPPFSYISDFASLWYNFNYSFYPSSMPSAEKYAQISSNQTRSNETFLKLSSLPLQVHPSTCFFFNYHSFLNSPNCFPHPQIFYTENGTPNNCAIVSPLHQNKY